MKILDLTISFLMAFLLTACSEAPPPQQTQQTLKPLENAVTLHGTVSDNHGLIKSGKVEVKTLKGELVAETQLQKTASYQLEIPAGSVLPLVITYSNSPTLGSNLSPMLNVFVQPGIKRYDINPLTTAIAEQARALGGYTLRNLSRAAEDAIHVPDANKTSSGFRGDPTTQYGGWH